MIEVMIQGKLERGSRFFFRKAVRADDFGHLQGLMLWSWKYLRVLSQLG
jgi:hypothetical protein